MQDQKSSRRLIRTALALALAVAVAATAAAAADARHAPAETSPSTVVTARIDAATRHHHPDVVQSSTRIVLATPANRFDWGDAGIGAAATLGAGLVIGGTAVLLTRRRTTISSPSQGFGS